MEKDPGRMKIKVGKFFLNVSEWVAAAIGFLCLVGIFICFIFGFVIFIWRTFFRC